MKKLYTPVGIVGVMCVATGLLPWIVALAGGASRSPPTNGWLGVLGYCDRTAAP